MEFIPLDLHEGVSVRHSYFHTRLPSADYDDVLVVRFEGVSGVGCANNDDAVFMEAMIRAGIVCWDPEAILLDLRALHYAWGDLMCRPLCSGGGHYGDGSRLPLAVVVSDANREGLESLVTHELLADPSDWLFNSPEAALVHLNSQLSRPSQWDAMGREYVDSMINDFDRLSDSERRRVAVALVRRTLTAPTFAMTDAGLIEAAETLFRALDADENPDVAVDP